MDLKEKSDAECKGLVFRGLTNSFWNGRKYQESSTMNLLKRKSCPGCGKCGWLIDELDNWRDQNIVMPEIEDKKLYTLTATNMSLDYESGYIDDYDLEFIKKKEQ